MLLVFLESEFLAEDEVELVAPVVDAVLVVNAVEGGLAAVVKMGAGVGAALEDVDVDSGLAATVFFT